MKMQNAECGMTNDGERPEARGLAWSVRPPVARVREMMVWGTRREVRKTVISEDAAGLLLYAILLRLAEDLAMLRAQGHWKDDPDEMKGGLCWFHCNAGHVKLRGAEMLQCLNDPGLAEWCEYLSAWLNRTIDRGWIVRRAKTHEPERYYRRDRRRAA